jgi:hypothetical protein
MEATRMTNELNGKTVAALRYWWDDQDPGNKGWYVEAKDSEGEFLDDSMKVWFPVDVEDFSEDEETKMVEALKAEFPNAAIEAA